MAVDKKLEKFIKIVEKLRRECPWDREQTFTTLKPYMVEEVYEALQAIDDKDYPRLAEELGDMLLHIVMLAVFAAEKNYFTVADVIDHIAAKMVRRHPHVFASGKARTKEDIWRKWEKIKQAEAKAQGQRHKGILDGIPRQLPALYRAEKVQRRAARVGFDWDQVAGAWSKVKEELSEVHELLDHQNIRSSENQRKKKIKPINIKRVKEEIGDLLFAIVNVARKLDIDSEDALQLANAKFMRRFSNIEKVLQKKKLTVEQMDEIWNKTKAAER